YIEFDCDWGSNPATAPSVRQSTPTPPVVITTDVPLGPTFRAYTGYGITHILTGFDHLLFVSALVLAARSFWDLVKVVTAFTLALISFSIGVELGHQLVVIPLFVFLKLVRKRPKEHHEFPNGAILKFGSAAISIAGLYFLIQAIR